MSVECKKTPFANALFIDRSKFRVQFLKRVTQGNYSMKLFQNLASGFREEDFFLRICSCPYSESNPHSLEPCLMADRNSANKLTEKSLKEYFCEIISKSD